MEGARGGVEREGSGRELLNWAPYVVACGVILRCVDGPRGRQGCF